MEPEKFTSLNEFDDYKKTVLSKEQVEFLLRENKLKLRVAIRFLLYVILLALTCLCIWLLFRCKDFSSLIMIFTFLVVSASFLFICARKVSVSKKHIKNLKNNFYYVEIEVVSVGKYCGCFAYVKAQDGKYLTAECPKEIQVGDKVLLYRVDGFKEKDQRYYLTKMEL